jgi:hypothetical protein
VCNIGADSHPYIEKLTKRGWVCVDDKERYWPKMRVNDYDESVRTKIINVLGDRDYTLFAVLADVRNDGVRALFPGRGTPEDASSKTKKAIPDNSDYHSHTYFTVQELLDTDWDEVGQSCGNVVLFADQFQGWKETGKVPDDAQEYACGGGTTRPVSEEEMTMLLLAESPKKLVKKRTQGGVTSREGPYIQIGAPLTYRQLVPRFISIIPELQKLGDPTRVRVVIAFDN